MALQAEQIDVAYSQHVSIRSSMRQVTGRASFDFHRLMLEHKWPLLVGMAGEANRILGRRRAYLLRSDRSVHIVAVRALNQAFIHAMMKRHLELSLLLQMATVTKLGLRLG